MKYLSSIFLFIFLHIPNIIKGMDLKYLSSFKFGDQQIAASEHLIKDYATLANDPKEQLPNSFTICSSMLVNFSTTMGNFLLMSKEDGSQWFDLSIVLVARDFKHMTEKFELSFENPTTQKYENIYIFDPLVPIVPHTWYHMCLGLDTVSGLLRIVVNGVVLVNEEKDFFKNTTSWKPRSLAGKISLFKSYMSGVWVQCRSTMSNMNIFSSMITVDNMVTRTSDGEDCKSAGDYLRFYTGPPSLTTHDNLSFSWKEMIWNMTGNVNTGNVESLRKFCGRYKNLCVIPTLCPLSIISYCNSDLDCLE